MWVLFVSGGLEQIMAVMLLGNKFGQMKPHNALAGQQLPLKLHVPASPVPYSCTHTSSFVTSAALLLPVCSEALKVVPKERLHTAAIMQHMHRKPSLSGARLPCIFACKEA